MHNIKTVRRLDGSKRTGTPSCPQNDRSYNARALPQFVAFSPNETFIVKQIVTKEMGLTYAWADE